MIRIAAKDGDFVALVNYLLTHILKRYTHWHLVLVGISITKLQHTEAHSDINIWKYITIANKIHFEHIMAQIHSQKFANQHNHIQTTSNTDPHTHNHIQFTPTHAHVSANV